MVSHRAADNTASQAPIAPVIKRKRRTSCLGEEERRERKRAIDREAQRSLREKTRTHIAELERTIEILRDQDRNGATANLLAEIDALRSENERLKSIIESVKSLVGVDTAPRNTAPANVPNGEGGNDSPPTITTGTISPKLPTPSSINEKTSSTSINVKPPTFSQDKVATSQLDIDGMNMISEVATLVTTDPNVDHTLAFQPPSESPEEQQVEDVPWDSLALTPSWMSRMEEAFGLNWQYPSPTILHVDLPNNADTSMSVNGCLLWQKMNELFSKVFKYCPQKTNPSNLTRQDNAEAGLLYMGIKDGWDSLPLPLTHSPALMIMKEIDQTAFAHLPKTCRLALAYKSFKLLKYYLNATKEQLERVPDWLRPSVSQALTKHPIAVDFFAWPSLRMRFLAEHPTLSQNTDLARAYTRYLRFEWPFSFEDAFFLDDATGTYHPSPLFERYHRDLKYWKMDEAFYQRFPEMRADIEGDRSKYGEVSI